ncbi:MAG TPA: SUF system NifU family Fe-S cluster assembly protein [Steroidobacteraceae bacterium]|jgi:nitrogen fixation NifU-like protein|nr:SUF system NifU family Fe-S cluster assembly protein [Steroidobacteraceae bacterium]
MDLNDLYRDVILDHNRRPRNFGALEAPDASVEGFNPMCGDRLTVRLRLEDDKISDIRFEGQGCAISTASASMMTEAVKGRTRADALQLFDRVHELLTDEAAPPADELGKLAALSGVRAYPARVKCASLCWHTLAAALRSTNPQAVPAVTTE